MSPSPLRFAIVGCGSIAPTHADALASLAPDEAILTACCDSVPERAQAFAEKYRIHAVPYDETLRDPDIDAVSVCAPSGLHAELGVPALKSGKHVIVEKPMDVSLDACDRLMAAQRESGRTFAVISQHRFDPASLGVKGLMDRGEFGPLVLADARVPWYRTQDYYDSGDWRGTYALDGGGCLMNQGVHTVDLLRWLCGPVATVYARAATLAHERIEVEDVVSATLTFASGAVGTLMASTAAYPGFAARLALHGTRGSAVIEGDRLHTLAIQGRDVESGQQATDHALQVAQGGTRAATEAVGSGQASGPTSAWGDAHRAELQDFIQCCRTGATPLVNGREGRNAVELVLAVYESARTGEVVRL